MARLDEEAGLISEREKSGQKPCPQHGIPVAYLWCQPLEPGDRAPRVLAFHGREQQMSDCHSQQFDYRELQRTEPLACGSLATATASGGLQSRSHTEGPWQGHTHPFNVSQRLCMWAVEGHKMNKTKPRSTLTWGQADG